jgi:hypothetical protein
VGVADHADLFVLIHSDHQYAIAAADEQVSMRRVEVEVIPAAGTTQRQRRKQARRGQRCRGRRVAGDGQRQQQRDGQE